MDKEQIKALALANGFKLKEQPDGNMDLNPYVYDFAKALINCDWYPVTERLPAHSKEVLVINSVEMLVGLYDENLKGWFCGKSRDAWNLIDGVTHWQPLPQLPSAVQDETV